MVDPHEHQFEGEPDWEYFEDGAFIASWRCDHVEILGSYTSERHDETFYEEGARCEEVKRVRMDCKRIYVQDHDDPDRWHLLVEADDIFEIYDRLTVGQERVLEAIEEKIFHAIADRSGEVQTDGRGISSDDEDVEVVEYEHERDAYVDHGLTFKLEYR